MAVQYDIAWHMLKGLDPENKDICTLKGSVATGFEPSARDEIATKLRSVAFCARGRVFFDVRVTQIPEVLKLRSVDHVTVLIHVDPKFHFTKNKDTCLKKLRLLPRQLDWTKALSVWQANSGFTRNPFTRRPDEQLEVINLEPPPADEPKQTPAPKTNKEQPAAAAEPGDQATGDKAAGSEQKNRGEKAAGQKTDRKAGGQKSQTEKAGRKDANASSDTKTKTGADDDQKPAAAPAEETTKAKSSKRSRNKKDKAKLADSGGQTGQRTSESEEGGDTAAVDSGAGAAPAASAAQKRRTTLELLQSFKVPVVATVVRPVEGSDETLSAPQGEPATLDETEKAQGSTGTSEKEDPVAVKSIVKEAGTIEDNSCQDSEAPRKLEVKEERVKGDSKVSGNEVEDGKRAASSDAINVQSEAQSGEAEAELTEPGAAPTETFVQTIMDRAVDKDSQQDRVGPGGDAGQVQRVPGPRKDPAGSGGPEETTPESVGVTSGTGAATAISTENQQVPDSSSSAPPLPGSAPADRRDAPSEPTDKPPASEKLPPDPSDQPDVHSEPIEKPATNDKPSPEPSTVPAFRATCFRAGGGKEGHAFSSNEGAENFGGAVQDLFGWRVDLKKYDIEVILDVEFDMVTVGLSLTPTALFYRNLAKTGPTSLRSTVCHNLLMMARPQPWEIVVDTMCGGGSISLEGAQAFPGTYHLCGDNYPEAAPRAALNRAYCAEQRARTEGLPDTAPARQLAMGILHWDATRLPLRDAVADVIATDLPFGKRMGSKYDSGTLYPAVMEEMARICVPRYGRAVLLTQDKTTMQRTLNHQRIRQLWRCRGSPYVNIGGLAGYVYLLQRSDNVLRRPATSQPARRQPPPREPPSRRGMPADVRIEDAARAAAAGRGGGGVAGGRPSDRPAVGRGAGGWRMPADVRIEDAARAAAARAEGSSERPAVSRSRVQDVRIEDGVLPRPQQGGGVSVSGTAPTSQPAETSDQGKTQMEPETAETLTKTTRGETQADDVKPEISTAGADTTAAGTQAQTQTSAALSQTQVQTSAAQSRTQVQTRVAESQTQVQTCTAGSQTSKAGHTETSKSQPGSARTGTELAGTQTEVQTCTAGSQTQIQTSATGSQTANIESQVGNTTTQTTEPKTDTTAAETQTHLQTSAAESQTQVQTSATGSQTGEVED